MTKLDFLAEKTDVTLAVDGRRCLTLGWKASLEVVRALDRHIRHAEAREKNHSLPVMPESTCCAKLSWRDELGHILLLGDGRLLLDLPTENVARQVWKIWMAATKGAEEFANVDSIARDAAVLHRSGAPFGLTSHPKIKEEIAKLSSGDRDLRRYMQDKRRGHVLDAPTIIRGNVAPIDRARKLASALSASQIKAALG